ncbi:HTH domain-containing protein [Paenibacillus elgii]|uniref:HTH domain-containing protein n=1 Tax=Paenibacillus elgii TaxID=189691 RepID=UPI001966E830|nr:hypothetical protein [Paenibacillus elgii]
MKRNYSPKTLKVLFALSGNQCAHPECTNTLIEPATEKSDVLVTANICHIYAISSNGPRGKDGLTEKELNSPENLILLCQNHHVVVDGQHETYPAEMLKAWKQTHESKMQKRLSTNLESVHLDIFSNPYFPIALVDQKIEEEINILRKSRFFGEFNIIGSTLALARRLAVGELSGGTGAVRSKALAWCARFLVRKEELRRAEEYLSLAKGLGSCLEIDIADAFVNSQKGNKNAALSALAIINSPVARSAALMVVSYHDGEEGAVAWLETVGFKISDLDSDGKYFLIVQQLKLARWDDAKESASALTDLDVDESPVLHHIIAMIHLLSTVPTELRSVVLNQLPFEAASFPLAADADAINARRIAQHRFSMAVEIACQLNCPQAATIYDEYALWLELMDPEISHKGVNRLESKLRDTRPTLRLVHLGLQFGIKLDLIAVEQEIERQIALNGEITQDAALARFALAFTQKTPKDVANYITRHYEELSRHVDKKSLHFLQIEMLSRAGFPERANQCLEALLEEGLPDVEENRLRRIVAEADGADPIETRLAQFKQTDSLGDLIVLVDKLESVGDWDRLCEYGEVLFERTRTIQDAERLARALSNTQKTERLLELVKTNVALLEQSMELRIMYCWALYNEGELLEARFQLAKNDDNENRNCRILRVNLGIALGDWNSLSAFLTNEIQMKDKRNAHELIGSAQLALHLNLLPYAKELILAAVSKANNDADVFSSAYFMATKAGWEGDAEVSNWIQKAVALSDDKGPIQQMTLKDLLERKPEWDSRETETWQLLQHGEIPQFLAAQMLNKSLIGLMLFPALTNLTESDLRRKGIVPAYSGARQPVQFENLRIIGIDATALLTLGFLNLLNETFDAFDEVYLPHSTLKWLFEEKQKITFHQPSRIKDAKKLRDLLATDVLEKFVPNTVADSDLAAQVGDELAILIAEAEMARDDDDTQRIVVRPYPVPRLTTLMEEEADLTGHAAVMSSCLSIVSKLRQKGQITMEEEKRALAYLQLHEKPWPYQPEISDGAALYLEDLATAYFQHLGLLEKLKVAGFKTIVSPRVISEVNELISYESISDKIAEVVELIRFTVSSRIESRKIKVGRQSNFNDQKEHSIYNHPTVEVISLAAYCDAIITDDRYINQHENINNEDGYAQIFSTLDILDLFVSKGYITSETRLEYRTQLRRAGYIFVPITEDELLTHLTISSVKNGKVIETAELKAIRESILRVRMSNLLQLPKEAPWLNMLFQVLDRVMKKVWNTRTDLIDVMAYSDWILEQIDVRGWVHSLGSENGDSILNSGRGVFILTLLTLPSDIQSDVKEAYWKWIEGRVLAPVKEQYPKIYDSIVEWQESQISEMADTELIDGIKVINTLYTRSAIALAALEILHPLVNQSLLEKKSFREKYGIIANAFLTFNDSGLSIQCSELYDAIRCIFSGSSEMNITDTTGEKWVLQMRGKEGEIPNLTVSRSNQYFNLPDFSALSTDTATRLRSLNLVASDVNLPADSQEAWRSILSERDLDNDEVDDLHSDFRDTPVNIERSIRREITQGRGTIFSLIPQSRRYYERLVGCYDGSTSIKDYAAGQGKQLFEQLSEWNPYDGFLLSLYVSLHTELTTEINVGHLNSEDFVRALNFLERSGDRISQLGAIEIGLRVLPRRLEIEPVIIRLIRQLRDDDVHSPSSGFKLLSALFILVDGELSRIRMFAGEPPFYRRLASLSQAALIHRQLVNLGIDIDRFCEWALNIRGEQFYFQALADMRLEPRWNPDLASASRMKAEFIGRIMIAAQNNKMNIRNGELHDLIFGTDPESINSLAQSHYAYFPGPLEGMGNSPLVFPTEILTMIETQLSAEEVGPLSFVALVNSALIFRVDSYQTELAAQAIKLGNYRLANVEDRSQLLAILNGLALVAAVARSSKLANELRILVRRYRNDPLYSLSIEEDMKICVVAAASYEDLNNWREFVGEWLTEMAFGKLEGDDGGVFLSHLQCLCHSVPELWVTCGRADAALKAYNAK